MKQSSTHSKLMNKIIIILVTGLLFSLKVNGQFLGGLQSSNQAGVLGVTVNPSHTNFLSGGTDFLAFGFSTTILNNGFYLDAKPITGYINRDIISSITEKSTDGESINEKFDKAYNIRRSLKDKNYIFADVTIYGPSFLINFSKHSFGIVTALKTNSNTVNMPKEMSIFLLKGAETVDLIGKETRLNNVRSNTMVYTDVALNYSYNFRENFKYSHRVGVNLHYLNGINSIIFQDNNNSKWSFIGDSSINFENSDFNFNYAAAKATSIGELMASRGNGFAFDIGYSVTKKKKGRPTRKTICPNIRNLGRIREFQEFKWRFGVSLMDVGFIRFTEQTSSNTYINANGATKNLDQSFYLGVFALERRLFFDFAGNPNTNYVTDNKYTQYTASRVNVQFDYALKRNWFINFNGTHRLPIPGDFGMRAANIISLTARREKEKSGIFIPLNLVEYQIPSLGFGFKVGPFFMGTNHVFELIGLRNIKGVDLYFGLKFNLSNFKGA